MPSRSAAQRKLMNIVAHTPGGYDGIPQKVGKEFHDADMKLLRDRKDFHRPKHKKKK